MSLKQFLVCIASTVIVTSSLAQNAESTPLKKPNVVFILADNVGYGDLGSYGGGQLRGAPTPRADELAKSGLRLTQYLVEPACTPSRAALMTGQYSIRNGLSLIAEPGTLNTLPGKAYTMGRLFKDAGYSTAIFGKWHLGGAGQSLPGAHGFDHYYGIPPDTSWDSAAYVAQSIQTHSYGNVPDKVLYDKGPWIVQQTGNGTLERVKPYTMAVRAEIDNELVEKSIAFMKQQNAANKPFFLYLPFSMGHVPNLPSKQFAGKSRIGQYGDKMMEGDYHVGQIMDTLKQMNIEDNTILVFASDNGSMGQTLMYWDRQGLGAPDMGSNGPFRGDLGEATEGAVRTFCIIRWPGKIAPGTTSNAMFSTMDFMPTFASILGVKLPTDRVIDGVNQLAVLKGESVSGNREALLSFIGPDLVAGRWKQWRYYFKDMARTGTGQQMLGGTMVNSSPLYYPKFYNIEIDPHEDFQMTNYSWTGGPIFKVIEEYLASVKEHPNPPPSNVTNFSQPLN